MDQIDRRILAELQRDATLPLSQMAARVGLSQTPCWKRVQKMEKAGIITGRVALVDAAKLGLGLTVYVDVTALDHTPAWREQFLAIVGTMPEVMDVFRLGGTADYMLRIVVGDMASYDRVYTELTAQVPMQTVTSRFVMEHVCARTVLPLA